MKDGCKHKWEHVRFERHSDKPSNPNLQSSVLAYRSWEVALLLCSKCAKTKRIKV